MTKNETTRMTHSVKPRHYQVRFAFDLEAATFLGKANIDISVTETTQEITLHAKELAILRATVRQKHHGSVPATISHDTERECFTLSLGSALTKGPATITVYFFGTVNEKMRGLYKSFHTLPDGTKRTMAVTQFEPAEARRAFPCFDEPSAKATFQITVVAPADRTVLSNMPIKNERSLKNGMREVHFQETPKMSTYLLALIVGDLEYIEVTTRQGTILRVWATPGKKEQGRFALETSVRVLEYFTDYFGIPYPLPKLDMVAVPDFEAGAMENWGLITYREPAVLFHSSQSSERIRRRVAEVVAHEIAHQWFGNLVTMAWWDGLWLNESFATFMAYKAVDALFPEWEFFQQFLLNEWSGAAALDALRNSHPIRIPVESPAHIDQIFDAISYNKGAAVLRMLEHDLGTEVFQKGIHAYLRKRAYANAETEDLWGALSAASGQNVVRMMDGWTKQPGYPVVHAARTFQDGKKVLLLRQERFLLDRDPTTESEDETLWEIPVEWIDGRKKPAATLFNVRIASIVLQNGDGFIKLNPDQSGFYHVCYAPEEEERLSLAVAQQRLPSNDRLGLLIGAFALMRAHYRSVAEYLSFVSAYRNDRDSDVLQELLGQLSWIADIFLEEEGGEAFMQWAQEFLSGVLDSVGWDVKPDEDSKFAMLRGAVLTTLGKFRHPEVVAEAQRRFAQARESLDAVHPDIRSAVFSTIARNGEVEEFRNLLELLAAVDSAEERARLLSSLGKFRDLSLVQEALRYALSEEVRPQDSFYVFRGLDPHTRDTAWAFMQENLPMLQERFGHSRMIGDFIAAAMMHFSDEDAADEMEQFFSENPVAMATMIIAQELERVRSRGTFRKRNRDAFQQWLEEGNEESVNM